jgi:hypothetical protein
MDKITLMKSSSVFLILGIIIVSIGLAWIISGGRVGTAETVPLTTVPTTVPAGPEPTTAVPVTTLPVPVTLTVAPANTTQVTTTVTSVSGDDIRNHFLDIAYTGTNRLELIDYSQARSRVIISAVSASDDDIAQIEKTAKSFNEVSTTVKLSENVKDTDKGDIVIKFLPEEGLEAIDLNTAPDSGSFYEVLTRTELFQGNIPAAKILRGTIYINANLKGDAMKHVLVRSLMYEMGLTGETTKYPDSIFYAGENTNVNFAPVDLKAIAMLYNTGFSNGMTGEDLRRIIFIP